MTVAAPSRGPPAQARHPARGTGRLPVEGRRRRGAVRREGEATRSRVRSYFATDFPTAHGTSCCSVSSRTWRRSWSPSEAQSLILENNLIKEYRPRFNVRLKDDKSYPSIAVTLSEPFPRVLVTRRREHSGRPLLRSLHRRRAAAADAGHHPPALHRPQLPRRSARGAPRATLPRLPHRPLQGAVHGLAGGGRLSADGGRRARIPRGPDRRSPAPGPRGDAGRQRPARTTSGPRSCGTRSAGWRSWRSRSASR